MMNYETVDHIIWECSRFEDERCQLLLGLTAVKIKEGTPFRDLCSLQKWAAFGLCDRFLRECEPENMRKPFLFLESANPKWLNA
jgi:hypothetical protein